MFEPPPVVAASATGRPGAGAPSHERSRSRLVTMLSALPLLPEGPVVIVQTQVPSFRTWRVISAAPEGAVRITSTRQRSADPPSPAARVVFIAGSASAERVPSTPAIPAPSSATEAAAAMNCEVTAQHSGTFRKCTYRGEVNKSSPFCRKIGRNPGVNLWFSPTGGNRRPMLARVLQSDRFRTPVRAPVPSGLRTRSARRARATSRRDIPDRHRAGGPDPIRALSRHAARESGRARSTRA